MEKVEISGGKILFTRGDFAQWGMYWGVHSAALHSDTGYLLDRCIFHGVISLKLQKNCAFLLSILC